jgi:hypothetical protein
MRTNIPLLPKLSYTYFMEQSPSWEAHRLLASQEIPRLLRNPKVHYRLHKCPPTFPILSQLDPVQTTTTHFLKIHHSITRPPTPGSPKWSYSLRFSHHYPVYAFPLQHTRFMPRPSHSNYHIQAYTIRFTIKDKTCELLSLLSGAVDTFVLGFSTT